MDIGSHGCTVAAVSGGKTSWMTFFAPVATGEIKIDVGPGLSIFAQKSAQTRGPCLIGSTAGDAEHIAGRCYWRRYPRPLHENILLSCVVDDVGRQ